MNIGHKLTAISTLVNTHWECLYFHYETVFVCCNCQFVPLYSICMLLKTPYTWRQLVWLKWNCYETRALRTIILFLNWYQTLYPTTLQWIPKVFKPIWIYRTNTRWYKSLHIQSHPRVKPDSQRQYKFPYQSHGRNWRKYIGEVALEYVLQTSTRAQCFHNSCSILLDYVVTFYTCSCISGDKLRSEDKRVESMMVDIKSF